MARFWLAPLGLLLLAVTGCASLPLPAQDPPVSESAYTSVYPYYIEFCALSEIEKKPGHGADIRGGIGGHSTVYLNGACLAGDGRQQLVICPQGAAVDGVGLSVNDHFANANWVAIPGRDFFYHGDLKPGQGLTQEVYDATKTHAMRLGLYNSVRFHDRAFDGMPAGYQREAFKYEVSIGTDYAINFGRDRYCARVPVTAAQMARTVAYLNALNRPYQDGKAEYEWSVLTDNCIHVGHNALSASGFWPLWPTHRPVLIAAFDFPVPKNEFVNILRRSNDMPIDDLLAVWNDPAARSALLAGDGLPTRDGALASFEPVVHDNALYETDLKLIFYDEPLFGHYESRYRRIARQPRYFDLRQNQAYFAGLYARIEAERKPLAWWIAQHPALAAEPDFAAFLARYYQEVAHRGDVIAKSAAIPPAQVRH
jgi:hypothetical protein